MKIKKLALLLLVFVTAASSASCSGGDRNTAENVSTGSAAQLKIDVLPHELFMYDAIQEFNETHKGINISYENVDYSEEYKNKYITRLSVGEGPDIIRVDSFFFPALHKVAESGIFYDINKLMNKDKTFKLRDYNQKALDAGVINGKRAFIPIGYNFHGFYARDGELKANGITADGPEWTLRNMAEEAAGFTGKNSGKGEQFIASPYFTCSDIVRASGLKFIDYKKKEASFDSPEFKDLLDIYKKLCACVDEKVTANTTGSTSEDTTWDDTCCPEYDNGAALILDNRLVSSYRDRINNRLKLYLFPSYSGEKKIILEPTVAYAINAKSKYKEEAYEFIKLIISEEYQRTGGPRRNFHYIPVNKNAYLKGGNFYIENLGGAAMYQPSSNAGEEETRLAKLKAQLQPIEDISVCDDVDAQIYNIIESEVKPFKEGKQTAEQTAGIIQDKVTLYLNE